jgi:hypothetical protein
MKFACRILLVAFLLLGFARCFAQDDAAALDKVYGLDQTLCNGSAYNYFPPYGIKGDQYLVSPVYLPGNLVLRGKRYSNLLLNLDILNQQLLLKYHDDLGAIRILEVSKGWLSDFRVGERNFVCLNKEGSAVLYQSLGADSLKILYAWSKTTKLTTSLIGNPDYSFTEPTRESFLYIDGKIKPFSSKKNLIQLFDPAMGPAIRGYIRTHRINLKKSSDEEIEKLILFIGKTRNG